MFLSRFAETNDYEIQNSLYTQGERKYNFSII